MAIRKLAVYILRCADDTYYTGVTNNLERRLKEHETGIDVDAYTYSRRPIQLVFYEVYDSPSLAISWEKRIKKWSKAKKEALINEHWDKLKELAACQNKSHYKRTRE